ncbi:MAG: flagellar hook assembly protein FlgD [Bacillota bacterium]
MTIEAASSTTNTDVNGIANEVKKELDKDAFFKLLITQLQNQDPLKPMEDKEFIAQMAQFSSLEQMNNINQNFKKLIDVQKVNQNSSLIGKTVEREYVEDDVTNLIKGEVEKISFEDGKAFAHLSNENNDKINVDDITAIY